MNDLDLLDRFGPEPTQLHDDARADARQQLQATITAARTTTPDVVPISARRPAWRRRVALVGVAAATAGGLAVVPALLTDDSGSPVAALAATDPLVFPVTATYLPEGLDLDASFLGPRDPLGMTYGTHRDAVSVWITRGEEQAAPADSEAVDIAGQPGFGAAGEEYGGHPDAVPSYAITWTQADGDVIRVSGSGDYADPATVERIAEGVVDKTQPVDLRLSVAPDGWGIYGYRSDHHISYGADGELAVTLLDEVSSDLTGYGATDVEDVTIGGRRGVLGRVPGNGVEGGWILETTAPDGQAFSLQAPTELTRDQVITIAAGVQHR